MLYEAEINVLNGNFRLLDKILGVPVSRRIHALANMASRDRVDEDAFHKGIQYSLKKLGKSKFGFKRTAVSNFKSKRHEGSGTEIVDYSRAPCLGADQKARGLWERDCFIPSVGLLFVVSFCLVSYRTKTCYRTKRVLATYTDWFGIT